MTSDDDAFEALGLSADAPPDDIERAYRRLIKQFHPDRPGGDGARAAEINRAFRHLRDRDALRRLPVRHAAPYDYDPRTVRPGRRLESLLMVLLAGFALGLAVHEWPAIESGVKPWLGATSRSASTFDPSPRLAPSAADTPPSVSEIDRVAIEASALLRDGGLDRLDAQSSRCHAELHRSPDFARLDRCTAFDEASHWLIASEGEARGRFATPAVIGRQVAAGRLLSNDYLAMESRFDLIRARVAFALAPQSVD